MTIKRRIVVMASVVLLSTCVYITSGKTTPPPVEEEEPDEDEVEDDEDEEEEDEGEYADWYPYDPDVWGADSPESEVCVTGESQSPVDLPECDWNLDRPELNITWGMQNVTLRNDGHGIIIDLTLDSDEEPTEAPTEEPTAAPTRKRKGRVLPVVGPGQRRSLTTPRAATTQPGEVRESNDSISLSVPDTPIVLNRAMGGLRPQKRSHKLARKAKAAVANRTTRWEERRRERRAKKANKSSALSKHNSREHRGVVENMFGTRVADKQTGEGRDGMDWPRMSRLALQQEAYPQLMKRESNALAQEASIVNRSMRGAVTTSDIERNGFEGEQSARRLSRTTTPPEEEPEEDYDDDDEDEEEEEDDDEDDGIPGELVVNDTHYKLLRCYFHWPSEHTIDGNQLDMNMDCLHQENESESYLMLSVFYKLPDEDDYYDGDPAEPDEFLAQFEDLLPDYEPPEDYYYEDDDDEEDYDEEETDEDGGDDEDDSEEEDEDEDEEDYDYYADDYYYYADYSVIEVDFDLALNGTDLTQYWTYSGSFTQPPCEESVEWYILMEPRVLTEDQLDKFIDAIGWEDEGGNFRPPQPLNDRDIDGCGDNVDWYPYNAYDWSYHVGDYSDEICMEGRKQSPIMLTKCEQPLLRPPIKLEWDDHAVLLEHDGNTIQLTLDDEDDASMTVSGDTFPLASCEFHWNSEHVIDGTPTPMAMHCIHSDEDNDDHLAIFSIFYDIGKADDPFLAQLEDILPMLPEMTAHTDIDFDLAYEGMDLIHYWSYAGSLTTPPCTEGVDWYLPMQRRYMSLSQYEKFQEAIGWNEELGNFRPPQPQEDREIVGCVLNGATSSVVTKGGIWVGIYIGASIALGVVWLIHTTLCIYKWWKRQNDLKIERQNEEWNAQYGGEVVDEGAEEFEEVVPAPNSREARRKAREEAGFSQ